jgi:hypothetical protein
MMLDNGYISRIDSGYISRIHSGYISRIDSGYISRIDSGYISRIDSGYISKIDSGYISRIDSGYIKNFKIGIVYYLYALKICRPFFISIYIDINLKTLLKKIGFGVFVPASNIMNGKNKFVKFLYFILGLELYT